MKKRNVHESTFEPRKEPRINHLNSGGKLDLSEPEIPDTSHHLNLGGKDKNDPGLKTPAATIIPVIEEPCCEPHGIYGKLCANIALDHYNQKNDTKFKLVADEPVNCSPSIRSYITWIRCFFKAKGDSSVKVFFAQLRYLDNLLSVYICKVLEDDVVDLFDEVRKSANDSLNADGSPASPDYDSSTTDEDAYEESFRLLNTRIAEMALIDYNTENKTKYVLVEDEATVKCGPFSDTHGKWFHCCFYGLDREQDNARHLFFAEVGYNYPSEPIVYLCKKLTDGNITTSCQHCYLNIEHPASEDGKYHPVYPNVQKDRHPKNKTDAHPYDYWDHFGIYEDPRIETDEPGKHCSRALRIFGIAFAEIALHHYNTANDSYFELVEDASLRSTPSSASLSRITILCSFIAKQRSSFKEFSAKLEYAYPPGMTVTDCMVIKSFNHSENDKEDSKHGKGKDIADESLATTTTTTQQEESSLRYNREEVIGNSIIINQ